MKWTEQIFYKSTGSMLEDIHRFRHRYIHRFCKILIDIILIVYLYIMLIVYIYRKKWNSYIILYNCICSYGQN